MPVVIGPTTKYFVELFNQYHNWRAFVLASQCSNLTHEELDALCCRDDVQRLSMFAQALPQERKTIAYVRDRGLFFGKCQTTFCQELFDCRFDHGFEYAFGFARHDEVIGISNKINP
jgi:hypothetical protein